MRQSDQDLCGTTAGAGRAPGGRRPLVHLALLVTALAAGTGLSLASSGSRACGAVCQTITLATRLPAGAPVEVVGRQLPVHPIRPGFLGLSIEYYAVHSYAGWAPAALNPVFVRLIRNLDPGQSPVLRIGGDSADWAWLPSRGVPKPAGARVAITPRLMKVLAALGNQLGTRYILDLDLEAGSARIARDEAAALLRAIGPDHIAAFEIGNEPELYSVLGWYTAATGQPVLGRPPGYSLATYEREFQRFAHDLPDTVALAGPASGQPQWSGDLSAFAATAPRLSIVTVHRYPLQRCQIEPGTPQFPTIAELLSPRSSAGLARSVIAQAASAHAHGKSLRVDELNSVACFGAPGVSNSFASALWMLETSFAMARVGVDGLNFHTLPSAAYGLFRFWHARGRWFGRVAPDYYGLLAFARAAPPRSKLLGTPAPSHGIQTWATRTRTGSVNVVLINTSPSTRTVGVRLHGRFGAAGLSFLAARALSSRSVSLGGASFGGATTTGLLSRGSHTRSVVVRAVNGVYVVRVPAPGAALLSFTPLPPHG